METLKAIVAKYTKTFKFPDTLPADRITKIREKNKMEADEVLVGLCDFSLTGNGSSGLYFTDKRLYWDSYDTQVDGKKKEVGSVGYRAIAQSEIEASGVFGTTVTVRKVDGRKDWTEIAFKVIGSDEDLESVFLELFQAFQKIGESLPDEPGQEYTAEDEQEDQAREHFINSSDAKTQAAYKLAFSNYKDEEGVKGYGFYWDWMAALFGPLYLVHRKMYKQAAIIAGATIFIGIFAPWLGILIWASVGTLGPFLLNLQFKEIKSKVWAETENPEERLRILSEKGGVNKYTAMVGPTLSFVILLGSIILGGWFALGGPDAGYVDAVKSHVYSGYSINFLTEYVLQDPQWVTESTSGNNLIVQVHGKTKPDKKGQINYINLLFLINKDTKEISIFNSYFNGNESGPGGGSSMLSTISTGLNWNNIKE